MNIGVLGGTFDPIHMGHLIIAEETRSQLDLAEVIFMPAREPWLKVNNCISSAEHRVQMVRLAIADEPAFKLSTMEIERAGPSYTVDTITALKERIGVDDKLFFILGWDNLIQLPQWHEPSRLVQMCRLVAVPRVGYPHPKMKVLAASVAGLPESVIMLNTPQLEISSSEIRNRVAQGLSIRHLVVEPVERYIKQHGLYIKSS